jgi:hypothetical protein
MTEFLDSGFRSSFAWLTGLFNRCQTWHKKLAVTYVFRLKTVKILAHAKGGPRSRICARKNPELTPKYIIVGFEVGVSEIFLGMQSYSFGNSRPYAKIGQHPKNIP